MRLYTLLRRAALGAGLLGATVSRAQSLAADSSGRPAPWLWKAGLRLTHLRYTTGTRSAQLVVPLSLGSEYQLTPRLSGYGQLELDVQASSAARRGRSRSAVAAAAVSLGLRCYGLSWPGFGLGRYVALEGAGEWQFLVSQPSSHRRSASAVFLPGLYLLAGTQNHLRRHSRYDLSAGLGLLAPARYPAEQVGRTPRWEMGAQVNVRLYFSN